MDERADMPGNSQKTYGELLPFKLLHETKMHLRIKYAGNYRPRTNHGLVWKKMAISESPRNTYLYQSSCTYLR